MARGQLRIYLGAAPGVGKTYRMLEEARRRRHRGTDVVIGVVETYDRPFTEAMLGGLEVVPRRVVSHLGIEFTEMDVDAVMARRPAVVLVDELAHANAPGSRHAMRWQDIRELLDVGISVHSTVNIQHLESLTDVIEQITGVPQLETVPDAIVRAAHQVELVDSTVEGLRQRMAHGHIYRPEHVDAALSGYFRVGNLTALRELTLLWMADKVEEQRDRYLAMNGTGGEGVVRERLVVALIGGPEGETLIRRAARIGARGQGADLLAVHVARSDGLAGADPANLARQRLLIESLGGTYHQVVGADVAAALLDFARSVNATQLVLGASRRGRLSQLFFHGVGGATTLLSGSIDVHLITHEAIGRRRPHLWAGTTALGRGRLIAGFGLGVCGLPVLTDVLWLISPALSLASDILLFLALVVAVALVGGLWPALLAAVGGFLLLNYFFAPPILQFMIAGRENVLALVVFVIIAVAVSAVVDQTARRTREAARASADASTLATVAGSVLRGARPLPALLERLRETFTLESVTLLERKPDARPGPDLARDPSAWGVAASVGRPACVAPSDGDTEVPVDGELVLALRGHQLEATDRRVVEAFAAQAALALRQERLAEQAAAAKPIAEADRMRTALLAAVSHDLRAPLASAKAAVTSLRSRDVSFSDADRDELLATADESVDRLTRLVSNLLDMSRLQAGALGVTPATICLEEAVLRALDELGEPARVVEVRLIEELPPIEADPALLERVLVNVIGNALKFSPRDRPPALTTRDDAGHVELRIVDRGPGIPESDRDRVFLPFQRLGDRDNDTGVGLGLALSRGLAEAMGGTLVPETTPGGGLTMVLTLPTASVEAERSAAPVEVADLEAQRRLTCRPIAEEDTR